MEASDLLADVRRSHPPDLEIPGLSNSQTDSPLDIIQLMVHCHTQRLSSHKSALLFVIYGANVKAAAFPTLADLHFESMQLASGQDCLSLVCSDCITFKTETMTMPMQVELSVNRIHTILPLQFKPVILTLPRGSGSS
ncbi:hypothetical protein FB451DRAFT_1365081 [Mycena latifolia]|nr:hypothetical protein FB451DRAFT_1365081 [Mycena latifolia]